MWCEENNLTALKRRSFSDAVIANQSKYNLEYCNNVTNSAGRRVWGSFGIEAVANPHINGVCGISKRTYVQDKLPEGWDGWLWYVCTQRKPEIFLYKKRNFRGICNPKIKRIRWFSVPSRKRKWKQWKNWLSGGMISLSSDSRNCEQGSRKCGFLNCFIPKPTKL